MDKPVKKALKPGQESVWDYPRPPRVEPVSLRVRIVFRGITLADTVKAFRVLETSHPPVYYIPPADIKMEYLRFGEGRSFCEWKGEARYYTVRAGQLRAEDAAWTYPNPKNSFAVIRDYIAFYASKMDECYLGDERVRPQPGGFYGGWITSNVTGPFKGEPGTSGW